MKCTQIFKRDSRSDKGIGYLKIRIEWAGKQRVEFGTGYTIQKSICELLDWKAPWLLYYASAGGVRTSLVEARGMKLTGYKKGFPDLFFYEPRQGFNGLAIELKRDKAQAVRVKVSRRAFMASAVRPIRYDV